MYFCVNPFGWFDWDTKYKSPLTTTPVDAEKKMVPGNMKNPTRGMFYFHFYLANNGINPLERCFNRTTCTKAEGHQRSEWKGDAVGCHAVCRWRFVGVTGSCPGWLVGWLAWLVRVVWFRGQFSLVNFWASFILLWKTSKFLVRKISLSDQHISCFAVCERNLMW